MRLLALLPALLLFAALPAGADALQCGEYRSTDGGMALVFTTPSSGYHHDDGSEPQPLWVDRSAAQTRLVMLDDGVAEPIRISADGQRIEDDGVVTYTLRQSRACTVEPSAMDGSCRAAGSHCIAQLPTASPGQAQRACGEGVGAGCSALLRQLRDGNAAAAGETGAALFERPSACREHTPGHDPQACEALTGDALAAAMQRVGERLQQEDEDTLDSPLPAAARDRLQQLCLQHRSGRFCVEVAEQQLIALEPALAVQALQVVCDAGRISACERIAPLRDLGADLRLVPALQVPCGRYQADGGVVDTLDFGDGTRGRLHDGAIHMQQNGETLVLRQLGNGDLLGTDEQTGYQRYQPVPGTAQCTPPREGHGSP
ncbi:hypothetical protein N7676_02165 [Stenotrophomonas sp. GD03993]|uniref:hypothetical protein n=1 Tax=unclassified Stenotrophomonas TaxID=196198 RepID=UPI001310266D|nr:MULTISPECIES: hypothetical protein [Stenotrophomonas]MBH1459758.1 hypothetical protein [Stenotrophomonas maltophilia]MDH0186413.1 hypothetical protein [Stenotrophomonas sp. GD04051]MDH0462613.1 hypothetical protein [Stenotrophomonas sp. GD03993]MDH0875357.1 hypothetical protein [Stenotrophomonas sp. GD03877]MDH2154475.1 hypothetical protein [Stenotrophomonas sp. GD03657]